MSRVGRAKPRGRGLGAALIPMAVIVISALAIAGVLLLGEGDGPGQEVQSQPTEPGSTLVGGPVRPGEHTATIFNPPLALTIGEGWSTLALPDEDQIMLTGPAIFVVTRVDEIRAPSQFEDIPVPDDLVEWFRSHPTFRADEPVELTIGGYPARQVDLTALDVVDTFFFPPDQYLRIGKDDRTRVTVINVDGAQVAAITTVEPDKFDAAVAQSQPIVESIRFYPTTEATG